MKETKKISLAEATHIVRDGGDEQETMNAFAGMKVTFLNTELGIKFLKNGTDYTLLLAPENANGTTAGTSLKNLIDAVSKLSGKTVITDSLAKLLDKGDGKGVDFSKITIQLTMAFLYIKKTNQEKRVDYAFMIKTDLKELFPEELKSFFTVQNIQLAVWNTKISNVLKAMNISTPEEAIKELENHQN